MWDKSKVASMDIDAQQGFTPLCPDELPVAGGHEIVDALNKQATYASIRIGSKDAHPVGALWEATPDKPQFSEVGLEDINIRWNRHCVIGTKGGELLEGLPREKDYDYFVWKGIEKTLHPYSAIYHDLGKKLSTGVIEFLKDRLIDTVIVGGLATDYCCFSTAEDLARAGFKVVFNLEAMRGIAKETTSSAIEKLKALGVVVVDKIEDVAA